MMVNGSNPAYGESRLLESERYYPSCRSYRDIDMVFTYLYTGLCRSTGSAHIMMGIT